MRPHPKALGKIAAVARRALFIAPVAFILASEVYRFFVPTFSDAALRKVSADDAFALAVWDPMLAIFLGVALLFYGSQLLSEKAAIRRWSRIALLLMLPAFGFLILNNERTHAQLQRVGMKIAIFRFLAER